jgi:L-threonylcarbamoyladenylate synthase
VAHVILLDPDDPDDALIREAAAVIRAGGLVAFPTETVYGLGADAFNEAAVRRIFAAKGRPADDPLIVHVLGIGDVAGVAAKVPEVAARLAAAFWPGPLTVVVPRSPCLPAAVAAGLDTVAVRAPAGAIARALIAACGTAIAAPSANRFGHTSPTTAEHVIADLGEAVDLVLDGGRTTVGIESTVVDCCVDPPRILRPGGVSLESIAAVVTGVRVADADAELRRSLGSGFAAESFPRGPDAAVGAHRSPGRLARHYAPRARLIVVGVGDTDVVAAIRSVATTLATAPDTRIGAVVAREDLAALGVLPVGVIAIPIAERADVDGAAYELYAALRALDDAGVTVILARGFAPVGVGLAVLDRLSRAADGRIVDVAPGGIEQAAQRIAELASGGP